jgi:hypothetical protein
MDSSEADLAVDRKLLSAVHVSGDDETISAQRDPISIGQRGTAEADLTADAGRHQADPTVYLEILLTV